MKSVTFLLAACASLAVAEECSPLHYIYARATTEVPTGIKETTTEAQFKEAASKWWSLGYGAAGGALWLNLTEAKSAQKIDGITGYPVPYPADASFAAKGAVKSSPQVGIDLMIAELKRKAAACPKQKYILGGHSQGGGVTVSAIKKMEDAAVLPKDAFDRILAVTMFGSPACPASVRAKCMSYCYKGDFACDPAAKSQAPKLPGGAIPSGFNITPSRLLKRQSATTAEFPKECPKDVKESGFEARVGEKTGAGPHLAYNQDGYYVKAAACYIKEKWAAAK